MSAIVLLCLSALVLFALSMFDPPRDRIDPPAFLPRRQLWRGEWQGWRR